MTGSNYVERPPGRIVGPIAQFFGFIINILFNIFYSIGPAHSLGLSIVLLTIIFRSLMLPLTLKSQRSMMNARKIKPELEKIQEKYGKSKDPEIMKKANAERAALMAKHNANPVAGCLPMLIQMPLFFGLSFIVRQSFLYIAHLRNIYYELAELLIRIPGLVGEHVFPFESNGIVRQYATGLISQNMLANGVEFQRLIDLGHSYESARSIAGDMIDLLNPADLSRAINRFTPDMWESIYTHVPSSYLPMVEGLVSRLSDIETFLIWNTGDVIGWGFPNILITIVILVTMLFQTWLSQQRQSDPNSMTDTMRTQQRIMFFVMPIMMAVFTAAFPVGVGIFWITSQMYAVIQELILNRKNKIPLLQKPW